MFFSANSTNGRETVDDYSRSGRYPTSITNESIAKIGNLMRSDLLLTVREMIDELNLSFYLVKSILIEDSNVL